MMKEVLDRVLGRARGLRGRKWAKVPPPETEGAREQMCRDLAQWLPLEMRRTHKASRLVVAGHGAWGRLTGG